MAGYTALTVVPSLRCLFPSDQHFFGLDQGFREIQLEQFFGLMQHLRIGYGELRSMPVRYRTWFISRLNKTYEKTTHSQGGIEVDDDTPISEVLGKMNKY